MVMGPSGSGGSAQFACPSCDETHVSAAGISGVGQFCAPRPPPCPPPRPAPWAPPPAGGLPCAGVPAGVTPCAPMPTAAATVRAIASLTAYLIALSESGEYSAGVVREDASIVSYT